MRLALAILVVLVPLGLAPASPAAPQVRVGVASSLEKLRPTDPIPPSRAIVLRAAAGECEAAQVAVRAPRGIRALWAQAEVPRGLEVRLYRVDFLRLARPSGPDGAAGEWPDPLIPIRDPDFGEARRAFPVVVPAGRLQSIWVEVCAPPGAAPGDRRGAVVLRDGATRIARVPVRVHVWPFALPRTPTFLAAFGLSTRLGTRALGVPDDPEVARALAAAALRHRVTPFTLSADPPDGRCTASRCALDWTRLDAELAPVLDGTLVPGVKGGFAEVRIPHAVWAGPEEELAATLRAWRDHFAERGWLDRLWLYTLDEPSPAQLPELARRARLARQAGIRVFATLAPHPALEGLVDTFVPNLTLLPDAPAPRGVSVSYASCLSHGCAELPAGGRARAQMIRAFTSWPGYEIDRPSAAARAVSWLAARRRLSGELYYNMLQAWTHDPWTDPRAFAGNGDGTLLYPGRPAELGGSRPFPVESIRLKVIRDGLEDVELLRLARAAGLGALCDRLQDALVPTARAYARDPASWIAARRRLGDALAARTATR